MLYNNSNIFHFTTRPKTLTWQHTGCDEKFKCSLLTGRYNKHDLQDGLHVGLTPAALQDVRNQKTLNRSVTIISDVYSISVALHKTFR
jgi:hypothetical protein